MTNISKEKIDNLILNYFIQEGYQEAAISFAKETNTDLSSERSPSQALKNNRFIKQLTQVNSVSDNEFFDIVEDYFDQDNLTGTTSSKVNSKIVAGYSTINQRKEIKFLILKGAITNAIQKISEYFPIILDSNNLLHFKLLRLNLIEMIRNHKLNNINNNNDNNNDLERQFLNDILTFVRENLINKVTNSFKLLKELEITMSLLCFNFDPNVKNIEDQKDLPEELRSLFNLSLRNQCYRLVNKAILNLYDNKEISEATNEFENTRVYKGPRFIDIDLSNLDKFESRRTDEEGNEDIDMLKEEINDIDYNYDLDYTKNINQIVPSNQSQENLVQDDDIEDEVNKLQDLSLESKLERIVKLWTITEQRLVDLNIIKEKRYVLNEEYL